MKNLTSLNKFGIASALATLVALTVAFPSNSQAADQRKGGQLLMELNSPKKAEALQPGDTVAMACAKCKSVVVERVTTEKGHIKLVTPGEKHLCPGCNSFIEVVGRGKQAKDEVRHVCGKCGDKSAYCCATKAGAGGTEGMDKK
jgi:hypothetical protein